MARCLCTLHIYVVLSSTARITGKYTYTYLFIYTYNIYIRIKFQNIHTYASFIWLICSMSYDALELPSIRAQRPKISNWKLYHWQLRNDITITLLIYVQSGTYIHQFCAYVILLCSTEYRNATQIIVTLHNISSQCLMNKHAGLSNNFIREHTYPCKFGQAKNSSCSTSSSREKQCGMARTVI